MAQRRDLQSFSIGAQVDWRVRQVSRLHLPDWHQLWSTLQTAKWFKKYALHEKSRFPKNKQEHCVNDPIIYHQQMRLSAFNENKAKQDLRFQCTCLHGKETHRIQQSNNIKNVWVSTLRRISLHLHRQHGQKAQRGGALHLWSTKGKNGSLKDGETKNGGISNNFRQRQSHAQTSTRRLVRRRQSEKVSVVVKVTWIWIPFVVLRTLLIFCSFWQFRVQTAATAMNATGSVQITLHRTHTRTFSLRTLAHARCDYTFGSTAWRFVSASISHFATGHVIAECSFDPICSFFSSLTASLTPFAPSLRSGVDRLVIWPTPNTWPACWTVVNSRSRDQKRKFLSIWSAVFFFDGEAVKKFL